jgi:hypothetical protein
MKKIGLLIVVAAMMLFAVNAQALKNAQGKFALHYAGAHDAKANTCDFTATVCNDIVVNGGGAGRYDVYVIAVDVEGIAGCRYGVQVDGAAMFFYGWTKCSSFEIPSSGWPGSGESNAQTWGAEVAGPHITLGILDVYAYSGTTFFKTVYDPRVGKGEFCDGTEPSPICADITEPYAFGAIGFNGNTGTNPCGVPVEPTSWGKLKAMYK